MVSHELTAYLSVLNLFLTQYIKAILSKGCKPDNFESNSLDILALCQTNLDNLVDSGNFSVTGCLLLVGKDSITHMHGLAVYVKEGLPFAWDLSLENSAGSNLCFRLALLHSVSDFFFLC